MHTCVLRMSLIMILMILIEPIESRVSSTSYSFLLDPTPTRTYTCTPAHTQVGGRGQVPYRILSRGIHRHPGHPGARSGGGGGGGLTHMWGGGGGHTHSEGEGKGRGHTHR